MNSNLLKIDEPIDFGINSDLQTHIKAQTFVSETHCIFISSEVEQYLFAQKPIIRPFLKKKITNRNETLFKQRHMLRINQPNNENRS